MVNVGSSQSGTDLAASAGDDITGSKSLTDLADLPVPVNRSNKKQVVSGWDDDGLVDDWNFDDIDESKEKKASKPLFTSEKANDDLKAFNDIIFQAAK